MARIAGKTFCRRFALMIADQEKRYGQDLYEMSSENRDWDGLGQTRRLLRPRLKRIECEPTQEIDPGTTTPRESTRPGQPWSETPTVKICMKAE
jgi:hypothetical protein